MFNLIRGVHGCDKCDYRVNCVHILAALYHHFIVKDDTTKNMTKFWTRKNCQMTDYETQWLHRRLFWEAAHGTSEKKFYSR